MPSPAHGLSPASPTPRLPWPQQALALLLSILATSVAPIVGNLGTAAGVRSWYPTLAKPSWTPPSWLFGPVWTVLYLAMAVAAFLVWRRLSAHALGRWWTPAMRAPLGLYAAQLALNALWSVLFFGLRAPGAALAEILLLLLAIVATGVVFARVSRVAGLLFVPYAAWVAFATALNAALWWLNR